MSTTPELKTCSTCGAPIFFLLHVVKNTWMPINASPDPNGNIVLEGTKAYRITKELRQPGELRYKSHYATCPSAHVWSGR